MATQKILSIAYSYLTFIHVVILLLRMSGSDEGGEIVDYEDVGGVNYENGNTNNEEAGNRNQENGQSRYNGKSRVVVNGLVPNVLFVSRFGRATTKSEVEELFNKYGPTLDITIKENIAFVDFKNPEDATRAKSELHFRPNLNSDSLIVDFKKDKKTYRPENKVITCNWI